MLYKLIYIFHADLTYLNVFRYITFRTILSTLTSLLICFAFGKWSINKLRTMQVGQYIREDGPPNHKSKEGTPTMGGCLFLPAILLSTLFWADLTNIYIWIILFVILSFGGIGFFDDYLKIKKKNNRGLSTTSKFLLQSTAALAVATALFVYSNFDSHLNVPFFKKLAPDLGIGYILLTMVVIVGSSNAVNLTDGLDGLAISPLVVAFACYLVFSYLAGHRVIASYLQIPFVSGAGEVCVLCGAVVGASLGVSGLLMQTGTRNPLADPYLLGVASGALVASNLMILLLPPSSAFTQWAMLAAGVAGGFAAFAASSAIAEAAGMTPSSLILAGIAVSSMLSGLTVLLSVLVQSRLGTLIAKLK
jgi:UDP-N-acetylmuramyl pentapeptide phosphotransferase/UDP-N-acetylglucosamine-1-phosphate transferase